MKTILLYFSVILFFQNCKDKTLQNIAPSFAKVEGKWKLYKISIGFRSQNGASEVPVNNEEIIEFNAKTKFFVKTIDGKPTEATKFDAREINNFNNSTARDAIVFIESNTYSFISFDESNSAIILYHRAPVGSELADGNSYHYRKIN